MIRGDYIGFAGALTILLAFPAIAPAQDVIRPPPPGQEEEEPEPELFPPELSRFVEADYPPEALEAEIEGEVVLSIEIDQEGRVTNVEVDEPAGNGFDEAAVAAARRFEFRPARAGDQPIPSRILYRYRFILEPVEPAEPAGPPTTSVPGRVTDLDGNPVPLALIQAIAAEPEGDGEDGEGQGEGGEAEGPEEGPAAGGETYEAESDEEGRFELGPLPIGTYVIRVQAAGYVTYRSLGATPLDPQQELTIRLESDDAQYETVVRARRPQRMVTRTVEAQEIDRVAGSAGDPIRAIQSLPGMNRTPLGAGLLIVRGSSPGDTIIRLESVGIPLLYHFGGIYSVINPRLIESIDFIPGNYPVRYAGAHGGVVDVRLRELQLDPYVGWHGGLSIDVIDIEAQVEGPIADGWSFALAARRSYIDAVAGLFAGLFDGVELTTAPVFWDYQGILQYRPNSEHFLRLVFYGSDDQLSIVSQEPPDSGQVVMGTIGTHTNFHGGILRYRYRPQEHPLSLDVTFAAGRWSTNSGISDVASLEVAEWDFELRPELTIRAGRWGRFTIGANLFVDDGRWRLTIPDFNSSACFTQSFTRPWENYTSFSPMLYAEAEFRPVDRFQIITGINVDTDGWNERYAIEPRLWMRYEIIDGTAVEGGMGYFHQSPNVLESDDFFGNSGLDMERSVQYALGVEQRIYEPMTLSVTGFYKWMDRLAVSTDRVVERDGEEVPLRYDNIGTGRIYGLEVMLRHQPTRWVFGWLSYTLMRSERRDGPDEPWELFTFDQTHILTLVVGVSLPRDWEIGLRFQLTSGRPFTPVAGAIYSADCDDYVAIPGEPNSQRMPLFHQLDLRIEKTWTVRDVVRINVYLDIQNVYYQRNVEAYFYAFDYSQRYRITGLPIIPNLGIGLEF